jgi:hypothetical protein
VFLRFLEGKFRLDFPTKYSKFKYKVFTPTTSSMKIKSVKSAIRVGEVINGTKLVKSNAYILYPTRLSIEWDKNFPHELKKKHLSIVYYIVVNDEIYKIGQTSGKNGIHGCMAFYFGAGTDDPGQARFTINYLMRQELGKGNRVHIYMQYEEPIKIKVNGIFSSKTTLVPISPKEMETLCLEDYHSKTGNFPVWNFQEMGKPVPHKIEEAFSNYRIKRNSSKKNK